MPNSGSDLRKMANTAHTRTRSLISAVCIFSLIAVILGAGSAIAAPVAGYKVVATYPHSTESYTEGFFYLDGLFYEGTGLKGHSAVMAIQPQTGKTIQQLDLPPVAEALHLWCQIAGKVRLSLTPWTNHSWHVPLYVSVRGLTTGLIPAGPRAFEMEFDLIDDRLVIRDTNAQERRVALAPQSVARFYADTMAALSELGYAPEEIRGALDGLRDDVGVEEMLRLALRELASR